MKRVTLLLVLFTLGISVSHAQDVTYVDTTSDSTSDITSTNTNTNTNTNTSTSTSTNTNNNTNNSTSTSSNTNTNTNTSTSTTTDTSTIDSTTNNTSSNTNNNNSKSTSDVTQTLRSPPPSAIAPSIGASSSDICTTGVSGAVQTQILGLSGGTSVRDLNCERLKISKTLYDMGMKVAAVSVMCQDRRVFDAMQMAGTPCPFFGDIGEEAAIGWEASPAYIPPKIQETKENGKTGAFIGGVLMAALIALIAL
jgi:hypothetical protein